MSDESLSLSHDQQQWISCVPIDMQGLLGGGGGAKV